MYVHIPFCERKCPYCDFYSNAGSDEAAREKYVVDLVSVIAARRAPSWEARPWQSTLVKSIYFGGGTPSILTGEQITRIMVALRDNFNISPDAEITIECNPNSLDEAKLLAYKSAGINRISIGVQSFSNKTLRVLGRIHDARAARHAVTLAARHFDNVSIDLMHSVPGGGRIVLPRSILKKCAHVSAYALTSDKFEKVPDERSIKEQRLIERILARRGMYKYEVSNFARPGRECRHNLVYWTGGRWLGLGDGAVSRLEPFTRDELIMLGLRLTRGIDVALVAGKQKEISELTGLGLLKTFKGAAGEDRVACTDKGLLLLNQVILKLI